MVIAPAGRHAGNETITSLRSSGVSNMLGQASSDCRLAMQSEVCLGQD